MADESQKTVEEKKFNLQKEIWGLIDEYLEACSVQARSPENIATWVYVFLGSEWYKENLHRYPYVAGKTLSSFASRQELRDMLVKFIGEDEYSSLCKMLHSIIELCTIITKFEANMIRLERETYEEGWITDRMPVKELKIEKEMYKLRLERIKMKGSER